MGLGHLICLVIRLRKRRFCSLFLEEFLRTGRCERLKGNPYAPCFAREDATPLNTDSGKKLRSGRGFLACQLAPTARSCYRRCGLTASELPEGYRCPTGKFRITERVEQFSGAA